LNFTLRGTRRMGVAVPMMPKKRLEVVKVELTDVVKDVEMTEREFVHDAAPYFGVYSEL
jgi:hypothetical protein